MRQAGLVGGMAALVFLAAFSFIGALPVGLAAAERARSVVETAPDRGLTDYLRRIDPARYGAMLASLDTIRRNPLVGAGLGSTRAPGNQTDITVHNAFLQAWADLGLLGLSGYCWLTLAPLATAPVLIRRARSLPRAVSRAEYQGAVVSLAFFLLWGLFQGIGVDPSAWLFFLLPWVYHLRLVSAQARTPEDAVGARHIPERVPAGVAA